MSDNDEMRERLREFVFRRWGLTAKQAGDPVCSTDDVCAFAASERALAVQELLARASEGAAPEFAVDYETLTAHESSGGFEEYSCIEIGHVRAEIDRLRAVVAAQADELPDDGKAPCPA